MFHEVSIENIEKGSCRTRVTVDGRKVHAKSYSLRQSALEFPVLNLEIGCIGKWSANGTYEVILDGLDDLARIMDEKELNSFVSLWQKYHSEGE